MVDRQNSFQKRFSSLLNVAIQDGENFIWEKKSRSGGNFTKVFDFTPRYVANKVVSTLNDFVIEKNNSEIYKCSIRMRNIPALDLTERFCLFNLSRTLRLDSPKLQEICGTYKQDFLSTQPGSTTQQTLPFWLSALLDTPAFDDIQNSSAPILYICLSGIIFTITIVPMVILVVIVVKRNSSKYSDDGMTATTGTETHQAGNMTSSSFVNVPLDQRKDKHKGKHSKHLIDGCSEYKENRKSQPHIYNEIEENENLSTPNGDHKEPSDILRGPYDITDLHSADNESYGHFSSVPGSITTPTHGERNINTINKADKLSRRSGEIDNVVFEGYEESKTSKHPAYAVIDAKEYEVDNLNRTSGETDNDYFAAKLLKVFHLGFSVVMEPSDGFKEYSDVFFSGSVVSLHCGVSGIDVDDANVSVHFNDTLIPMTEKQFMAEGSVTRNGDENAYRIQIDNVTTEHQGCYTCRVHTQEMTKEDSFFLNVASDSPQCITRCNELEEAVQLLCYSRQPHDSSVSFRVEESQNGTTRTDVITGFSPFHSVQKRIAPLNVSYHGISKTYKCSVEITKINSSEAHNSSCFFKSTEGNAICRNVTCPRFSLTTSSHFSTQFSTTERRNITLPTTLSFVSVQRISTNDGLENAESQEWLLIGLSALCCTLIIVLTFSCIVVSCVLRKSSRISRSDQSTTTAGASADQIGFQTNIRLSFVTPEQNKDLDKHAIPTAQVCSEHKQNIIETNSFYNDPDKLESLNARINDNCQNLRDSTLRPYEYIDFDLGPAQEKNIGLSSMVSIGDVTEGTMTDIKESDSANLDQTCDMIDNIVYEPCSDTK
ncbi:hypothetical protein HOLleu_26991 [Holothuria leucospilota]|uniref:Ig-like domain-containing protein n=1 Tax=Holothuria leucospilota TaxID=206669 RepID=A0A9Q1H1Z3_HOLLE|nr:hypothetical protein HOLleu_26991 [Holothuria leucospilota]